jgi:hypothetical protein
MFFNSFTATGAHLRHRGALSVVVMIVLCLAFAACSEDDTPDEVVGVIMEVRLDAQQQVESIRLRDRDDHVWELPVEFDPGSEVPGYHLEEHRAQRLPVVVRVRESANGLYASEINDVVAHQ